MVLNSVFALVFLVAAVLAVPPTGDATPARMSFWERLRAFWHRIKHAMSKWAPSSRRNASPTASPPSDRPQEFEFSFQVANIIAERALLNSPYDFVRFVSTNKSVLNAAYPEHRFYRQMSEACGNHIASGAMKQRIGFEGPVKFFLTMLQALFVNTAE